MDGRVLVAYGSKCGSTKEIAEAIAMELRLHRLDVDVRPADVVMSVHPYEFVILGSAIYAGRWRRPAMRLLRRERKALMARRVWLFQSGLSVTGPGPWKDPTPPDVATLAAEIGVSRPVTFAGALLPETARGLLPRLMARTKSAGEHRDWDRIRAWAREISAEIAMQIGRSWSASGHDSLR
ncbi:flavodoxin domain-containing protein [Sporichthya polymorpha]|uniref:flavodoxin domain-containing protein n=1 Tax=Sporichthya polymorpha TaxID=35751 RepID=UPI00037E803F|nr:flavodoxin domain-containing protein [Sporichthya polymorpha]